MAMLLEKQRPPAGRPTGLRGRDLLSLRELTTDELLEIVELAGSMKRTPARWATALSGRTLALLFEKPSLRTRVAFDVGMYQLGGHVISLSASEVGLGRREAIEDVARNLDRLVDGIVVRTFGHETVERLAVSARVPVINGLSDFSHPCQALADYQTILERKGRLRGVRVAFVGDGNNVATSLAFGAALVGAHFTIASPPGFELRPDVVEWARAVAASTGATCVLTHDPVQAVAGADVVYTDVWTSMGQEAEAAARRRAFRGYQVDVPLFELAAHEAMFMHCLPAHRGEEVTDAVIDSARSVVFEQAENRLHAQKALLALVLG